MYERKRVAYVVMCTWDYALDDTYYSSSSTVAESVFLNKEKAEAEVERLNAEREEIEAKDWRDLEFGDVTALSYYVEEVPLA